MNKPIAAPAPVARITVLRRPPDGIRPSLRLYSLNQMPHNLATAVSPPPPPDSLPHAAMVRSYDRRTRAAYEVMGTRWQRFLAAKEAFLAAAPGSREWYEAGERAYALGLRSTHAYYLWTRGHTALALDPGGNGSIAERTAMLRIRLRSKLQSRRG